MHQDEPGTPTSGYLRVGELAMYYEVQGEGAPLVLLHGGMMTFASTFGRVLPALTATYQVIGLEQQGHGHTADIDRPLRFPNMIEDTVAALARLGVARADFWGFSDGGILALGLAIRHPELVRSLTLAGVNFNNEGMAPGNLEFFATATAADMHPQMAEAYAAVAPYPEQWATLVARVMELGLTFPGWPAESLRGITAPALVIAGDADVPTPEHSVELFRLLPDARLAILPGTDHAATMIGEQAAWTLAMFQAFQAHLATAPDTNAVTT